MTMISRIDRRSERAFHFTLIELLVVVTIITILAALLLPALQRAVGTARAATCMGNMRQIGLATQTFTDENDGRFPGRYYVAVSWGLSAQTWNRILEQTVFEADEMIPWRVSQPPARLTCPSHARPPETSNVAAVYAMDRDAVGGPNNGSEADTSLPGSGSRGKGPYGVYQQAIPEPIASTPGILKYSLGARVIQFQNPSHQFMMSEIDRAGVNTLWPSWPYDTLDMADDPSYPAHCAESGMFSFRHPGLRGNFIFIDGHAESLSYHDEINTTARMRIEP